MLKLFLKFSGVIMMVISAILFLVTVTAIDFKRLSTTISQMKAVGLALIVYMIPFSIGWLIQKWAKRG